MMELINFVYDKQQIFIWCDTSQWIYKHIKKHMTFFEEPFLRCLKIITPKDSVIIDVGAHIGNHTIFFSKILKAKKVITIEPTEASYDLLRRNVSWNLLNGIKTYRLAISSELGVAYCDVKKPSNIGANRWGLNIGKEDCNGMLNARMPAVTLSDVVYEPRIDLIKIDVEGSELEVIEGAIGLINKHRPYLMVEVSKQNLDKFERLIEDLGYMFIAINIFEKKEENKANTFLLERRKK